MNAIPQGLAVLYVIGGTRSADDKMRNVGCAMRTINPVCEFGAHGAPDDATRVPVIFVRNAG